MRPSRSLLVALGAMLAGCMSQEPPARPAWDQHVLPLLQGSCNHCHGETVGKLINPDTGMTVPPVTRLDFCKNDTAAMREVGVNAPGSAAFLLGGFAAYLEPDPKTGRAKMPPPPAAPLSDWEYQVLKRWVKILGADADAACLKAVKNRVPSVKLVEPARNADDAVEVVVEVTDADNDGILGKATLGSTTVDVPGAGRRTLRFPKGTPANASLTVVVTDGYDVARL